MELVLVGLCLLGMVGVGDGLASGAPKSTCTSLRPSHGVSAQSASSLQYKITSSAQTYAPGDKIAVKIEKTDAGAADLQGYVLQARSSSSGQLPLGTFQASQGKVLDCQGGSSNTPTHSNTNSNQNPTFEWTAPDTNVGDVYFVATVAESFLKFWTDVRSEGTLTYAGDPGDPVSVTTTTGNPPVDLGPNTATSIRTSGVLLCLALGLFLYLNNQA